MATPIDLNVYSERLLPYVNLSSCSQRVQFILTLEEDLKAQNYSSTICSLAIMRQITAESFETWLPVLSACLRHAIDLNTYLQAPQLGPVHYLVCVMSLLIEANCTSDQIEQMAHFLIWHGSSLALRAFELSQSGGSSNLTVEQWAKHRGLHLHTNYYAGQKLKQASAALVLNRIDLLDFEISVTFEQLLLYQATQLLAHVKISSSDLRLCVNSYSIRFWEYLLEQTSTPLNYSMINLLCQKLQQASLALRESAYEMLRLAIYYGARLDTHQLKLVSGISDTITHNLRVEYEIPFWQKWLRSQHRKLPRVLRGLAVSLNLVHSSVLPSSDWLLRAFTDYLGHDDAEIISLFAQRQRTRVHQEALTYATAFEVKCPNEIGAIVSPYEYADLQLFLIASLDLMQVYAFNVSEFDELATTQTNPISKVSLTSCQQLHLQGQIQALNALNCYEYLEPISKAMISLRQIDEISLESTQQRIQRIERELLLHHIPLDEIKNSLPFEWEELLGYGLELSTLTREHAYATFCWELSETRLRELQEIFSANAHLATALNENVETCILGVSEAL